MANTHSMSSNKENRVEHLISRNILWPFILLTSCFAWWGLANNITDTLLAAFKKIMSMSDFEYVRFPDFMDSDGILSFLFLSCTSCSNFHQKVYL